MAEGGLMRSENRTDDAFSVIRVYDLSSGHKRVSYRLASCTPANSHTDDADSVIRVYDLYSGHKRMSYRLASSIPAHSLNAVDRLEIANIPQEEVVLARKRGGLQEATLKVGEGAYGIVYGAFLCRQEAEKVKVVVKRSFTTSQKEPLREAQFLKHLEDTDFVPRLLGITEIGELGKGLCIVQSYFARGVTLSAVMYDEERLPPHLRPRVAWSLAEGLRAIHGKGVLINDISSRNVLIDVESPERTVKYIDMGMATFGPAPCPYVCTLGMVMFAPEVQAGGAVSEASDVFSLGHLMLRMSYSTSFSCLEHARQLCMAEKPEERDLEAALQVLQKDL
ncbi:hypothetical protein ACOMHN_043726 [Nucella lapillus]